ncbi:hypothetical protein ACFQZS_03860 [Mucilaginibacter calamicampi]|uniref:GIY-YIG domain-containing protein n=1 Tax=Mucilaginibacter calamicampi TaxID=1302352 RepID=A0ABW2YU65_9SPHI
MLELEHGYYYIGSGKRLGKSLGEHFNGKAISWTRDHKALKVAEWFVIKSGDGNYLDVKDRIKERYILQYGQDKVLGGNKR